MSKMNTFKPSVYFIIVLFHEIQLLSRIWRITAAENAVRVPKMKKGKIVNLVLNQ